MRLILLLCLVLQIACHLPSSQGTDTATQQDKSGLKLIIPKADWDSIFFPSLNKVTKQAELPNLREVILPPEDLEVRIWGVGSTAVNLLRLKRSAGQWSATYISSLIYPKPLRIESQRTLSPPKSGWEACWQRFLDAGLLVLPDARDVREHKGAYDGLIYIVEINQDRTYRTYAYDNPFIEPMKEDWQILEIGHIIAEEFGVDQFDNKGFVGTIKRAHEADKRAHEAEERRRKPQR